MTTLYFNGSYFVEDKLPNDITINSDVQPESIFLYNSDGTPLAYRLIGNRITLLSVDPEISRVIMEYMSSNFSWSCRYRILQDPQSRSIDQIVCLATIIVPSPLTTPRLTLIPRNIAHNTTESAEYAPRALAMSSMPRGSMTRSSSIVNVSSELTDVMKIDMGQRSYETGTNVIPIIDLYSEHYRQVFFMNLASREIRYGYRFEAPKDFPPGRLDVVSDGIVIATSDMPETKSGTELDLKFDITRAIVVEGNMSYQKLREPSQEADIVTGAIVDFKYIIKNYIAESLLILTFDVGNSKVVESSENIRYKNSNIEFTRVISLGDNFIEGQIRLSFSETNQEDY